LAIWNIPGMNITQTNTVLISTPAELQAINANGLGSANANRNFVLVNNIELTKTAYPAGWTPIGTNTTMFTAFYGKFYGNGNKITMNCGFTNETSVGIFGNISGNTAEIRDLTVHYADDVTANSSENIGGIVGHISSGAKITNCIISSLNKTLKVTRTTGTTYLGGIAGRMECNVVINNAFVSVNLELNASQPHIGGVVGAISGTSLAAVTPILRDIKVLSNIKCRITITNSSMRVGGITGSSNSNNVKLMNLSYSGTIDAVNTYNTSNFYCGGIVGYGFYPRLENCVFEKDAKINIGNASEKDLSRLRYIGGIAGELVQGISDSEYSLSDCIARGDINVWSESGSAIRIGGIAGYLQGTNDSNRISLDNCVYEQGNIFSKTNSSTNIGGVVGDASRGAFTNCFSRAALITIDYSNPDSYSELRFGGFGGSMTQSTVNNCGNSSPIVIADSTRITSFSSVINIGGFAGTLLASESITTKLENCWSIGSVYSIGIDTLYTGGLVGYLWGSANALIEVINCWADSDVIAESRGTSNFRTGGLVGNLNSAIISESYFSGSVTALTPNGNSSIFVGGLVGHANSAGSITNCYATGNVLADKSNTGTAAVYAGGLVGASESVNIQNNFASGSVVAQSTGTSGISAGGLIGQRLTGANIQNNTALGASVTAKGSGTCVAARVYANPTTPPTDGSISGNYARDDMRLEIGNNYYNFTFTFWDGTGTAPGAYYRYPATNTIGLSTQNGQNASASTFRSQPFWRSGLNNLSGNITFHNEEGERITNAVVDTPLSVRYSGRENVTLQWYRDSNIITGETGESYTPTAPGSYTVIASNSNYSPLTSASFTVVANASVTRLQGILTISPKINVIGTVLTAAYSGTETVTYQWHRDGEAISDATSVTYTANTAGRYHVTATLGVLPVLTSESVTITGPGMGFNLTYWNFNFTARDGHPRLRWE